MWKIIPKPSSRKQQFLKISHCFSASGTWKALSQVVSPAASHQVSVKILARAAVMRRLDWSESTASRRAHSANWQAGVGCRKEASIPHHAVLSMGCLSILMTWPLASPWTSDIRQSKPQCPSSGTFNPSVLQYLDSCPGQPYPLWEAHSAWKEETRYHGDHVKGLLSTKSH